MSIEKRTPWTRPPKTPTHRFARMIAAFSAAAMLSSISPAVAQDHKALIERARAEAAQGKFISMLSSPKGEKGQRAIMDAFQKRFDIKLDWEWLPLTSRVSAPRIVEQAKAGVRLPTVVGGYAYETIDAWIVKNGLDVNVDWMGEFGTLFPALKPSAVDSVLPKYRNKVLRQWDVQFVMVYNTDLVKRNEVPKNFAELAGPKWKARFALGNVSPPPLDIMALDLGLEGSLDLTRKLLANQPRFKPGQPAVVGAVATGEVAVGVGGYTALAEAQQESGAPIAWAPMDNLPIGPLFAFMLKESPQPTLGKLFLAWLMSEGLSIQEKEEHLSLFTNPESPTRKKILSTSPNIKVIQVTSENDQVVVDRAGKEVMGLISRVAGK